MIALYEKHPEKELPFDTVRSLTNHLMEQTIGYSCAVVASGDQLNLLKRGLDRLSAGVDREYRVSGVIAIEGGWTVGIEVKGREL